MAKKNPLEKSKKPQETELGRKIRELRKKIPVDAPVVTREDILREVAIRRGA